MKKILVVGHCNFDGPRLVRITKDLVKAEAIEAKTIDKAIAMLKEEKYDLILVNRIGDKDKRNGLELIDWVQENQKQTKIMLITNYEDKMQEALEHGAIKGFGKALVDEEIAKMLKENL